MCVLKAFSQTLSFKAFAESTRIPVYSCEAKGEVRSEKQGTKWNENRISFDVSDRDWDDFPGQVEDAIRFLEQWSQPLIEFKAQFSPDELLLDFPINSRLEGEIVNQNDYLPARLVALAGQLGIGIGMSIYRRDAFEKS